MSRKKQGGGKRRKALEHDEPFRTCVACRTSSPKERMLRFARAPDGTIGFDVRARVPGRGAWTCATAACVKKAVDKGGFERAFEAPIIATADDMASQVRATLESEAMHGLGLLKRSNQLAAGREDCKRAREAGKVSALVLACDLSERSRREVLEGVEGVERVEGVEGVEGVARVSIVTVSTQERLGSAIGRKPTGVLALLEGPRAAHAFSDLERFASFVPQRLAHVDEGA